MFWKIIIALAVVACIAGGVVWISHGMHIFTHDREEVITMEKDELFGTEREVVKWVDAFKLGLLPDAAEITLLHRSYAFILGSSAVAIILSIIMLRRSRTA